MSTLTSQIAGYFRKESFSFPSKYAMSNIRRSVSLSYSPKVFRASAIGAKEEILSPLRAAFSAKTSHFSASHYGRGLSCYSCTANLHR